MSGASTGMRVNTSRPMRWLEMNPCPVSGSTPKGRMTSHPRAFSTPVTPVSSSTWVGHPATFADSRRSPDVMRYAVFGAVVGRDAVVGRA